ncbi:golgin subfamily A member 6-like protein 24 [Syngnathus scovelli]|uniref:golgin subfamily A member 6-like protein 24 n=1 Tax=Syngnathus scovelli TaxID=161590 RepID=UPI00210F95F4|nr:golgin subfamily A member 6-like protein 22 [Syngnathus scovelli]XP_049585036.1 golgin subfamily A member 6-like protein 22 [Syngnathus scovelli]
MDLSLSPLSRGYARVFTESTGDNGRLDVCYTPQDYYIWKSHDVLLHLTNSGSLLGSEVSTIPKTYSTRRGPLVLYSRDLVTLETEHGSEVSGRRRRVTRQEVDHSSDARLLGQQQNGRLTSRFAAPTLPPLPNIRHASVCHLHDTRAHHHTELLGDPGKNNSRLENPPKDQNEKQGSDRRVQLDLVLDLQTCIDHITLEELEEFQVQPEGSNIAKVHHKQCLPPGEDNTMGHASGTRTRQEVRTEPRWVEFHPQACPEDCHHHPLFLPLLLPVKKYEKMKCKRKARRRVKTAKEFCEEMLQHGQQLKKSSEVLLGLAHVGVSRCASGCRGPGRQSSSAFTHNRVPDLHDSCYSSDSKRSVVRGVLPLELRDWQKGQAAGCVILGPDGEIIQLSLYDNYQHQVLGDDNDTEHKAFQVLSADGETLPFVMVLHHEHTHAEEDEELSSNILSGDVQYDTTCLDLCKSSESDLRPPSSPANLVVTTNENTKRADPMEETRWEDKQDEDVQNKVEKLSPRKQIENPAGGCTAEHEEVAVHLPKASSGRTDQLGNDTAPTQESGLSTTSIQQGIATRKPLGQETAVGLQKDVETNITKEAAGVSLVNPTRKTVKSQEEGQMLSRKNKVGIVRKQKKEDTNAHRTKIRTDDNQAKKNATETQKHSAVTSGKKKRRVKERENSERRTKEKGEKGRMEELIGRTKPNHNRISQHDGLNVPSHKQLSDGLENEVGAKQETDEGFYLKPPRHFDEKPKADTSIKENHERLSADDKNSTDGSVHSVGFQMSPSVSLGLNGRSSLRSSSEGLSADMRVLTSSQGQLSSCSTIMVTEEQLMLKLVKTETSRSNEEVTRHHAERAEIRRQEAERRRMEQEEEERMQLQEERKRAKENIKNELEEDRRRRAEHLRMRKLAEEEVTRKREQEEKERAKREQTAREMAMRRQEERRRQIERLQKMREEEARRRKAEVEHLHLEKQKRQEEVCKLLQELNESERDEYLAMKEQEEEERRTTEEEHQISEEQALRVKEESRVQADQLSAQMALLERQMAFKRALLLEAEGMAHTQAISRPWVYSYFTLLRLLDLKSTKVYEAINS